MTRSPFQLGLNLPYVEGSMDGATPGWGDLRAMARTAEAVGFDAVWVSDHVGFGDPAGAWSGAWESWTLLSALAAVTRRVRLGSYVLCAPFRQPAILAKQAETLDEVSDGRLVLGLGAGWNEAEFTSSGIPFADRFGRFEDTLRIVAAMLREGRSSHEGATVTTRSARAMSAARTPSRVEIMAGAGGPRLLRLTAELADHWNGGLRSVDEVPGLLARVDAACLAAGREPATLRRSVEVLVRVLPDPTDGPAEERELRGTPAELAERLLAYAALGIDELQVQLRPNRLEAVEAFAEVIAALRAAEAAAAS